MFFSDMQTGFQLVTKYLTPYFLRDSQQVLSANPKGTLQHLCQNSFHTIPEYRIVSESGPDHEKSFVCEVSIPRTNRRATASGRTKRVAEKMAANAMLKTITPQKPQRNLGIDHVRRQEDWSVSAWLGKKGLRFETSRTVDRFRSFYGHEIGVDLIPPLAARV